MLKIVNVLTVLMKEFMTTSNKEITISHCIICDEMPPCKATFHNHVNKLAEQGRAVVTWKTCDNCRQHQAPSDTMCLVTFTIDTSMEGLTNG